MAKRFAKSNEKRCVSCGACVKECPRNAVEIWKGCFAKIDVSACVGCGKCSTFCPADCISFEERGTCTEIKAETKEL